MKHGFKSKVAVFALSAVLALTSLPAAPYADEYGKEAGFKPDYRINNPYEEVDWENWKQYKGDFHAHSTNSDGGNLTYEMVEDHYAKGYDILAMTDHNYVTRGWENADEGAMELARKQEIEAGTDRDGRGMLDMSFSNEQSKSDHINTFNLDFNNEAFPEEHSAEANMATTLNQVEAMGAIAHINHMGRYTGGNKNADMSHDPETIAKYVHLLRQHPATVGMEIINKIDNESRNDRALYDNILMQLMPENRNVWGFANDDTHHVNSTGYAFNMLLMPELSIEETRKAMENGAFYGVTRVARNEGINAILPDGSEAPGSGNESTLYMLEQTTPAITNIVVDQVEKTITIEGTDFDKIEWIADGKVIATGEMIDLDDFFGTEVNSYVRAELESETGLAFTQPFRVFKFAEKIEVTEATANDNQIVLQLEGVPADGAGHFVYLSENKGEFVQYEDVSFSEEGVTVNNLEKGKRYDVYLIQVEDDVIMARSAKTRVDIAE
ncbi:MAG: hypothetical protein Q4D97_02485 [Eubacteriales bacterium]|nr:hypothetical protein [Eubacteriales bacterium]